MITVLRKWWWWVFPRNAADYLNGAAQVMVRDSWFTPLRRWLLSKLYAIPKEERDCSDAKLGTIIERHMDDEIWLMKRLGIEDYRKYRRSDLYIDRDKIEKALLYKEPGVHL